MRRKKTTGITFKKPIKKNLTRKGYTPYINFDIEDANIIILAYQPGYGKTYTALKYMRQKSNANTFYFTNRHDAIDERIKDWKHKNKPLPTHWKGFEKICSDKSRKSLYKKYKLSPQRLCNGCPKKAYCDYTTQFNKHERVFSPNEYLSQDQFINKINKLKTIFVDERISKVEVRSINKKEVIEAFKIINTPRQYRTDITNRVFRLTSNF